MNLDIKQLAEAAVAYMQPAENQAKPCESDGYNEVEVYRAYIAGVKSMVPRMDEMIAMLKKCRDNIADLTALAEGYENDYVELDTFIKSQSE